MRGRQKAAVSRSFAKKNNKSCFHCGSTHRLTLEHVLPRSLFKHYKNKNRLLAMACENCNNGQGAIFSGYDNLFDVALNPTNVGNHKAACRRLMDRVKRIYKNSPIGQAILADVSELISIFEGHSPLTFEKC